MNLLAEFNILSSVKNWKLTKFDDITLWTCDHPGYYLIHRIVSNNPWGETTYITPSVYYVKNYRSKMIINGKVYIDDNNMVEKPVKTIKKSDELNHIFPGFIIYENNYYTEYALYITNKNNKKKYLLGCTLCSKHNPIFRATRDKIQYY